LDGGWSEAETASFARCQRQHDTDAPPLVSHQAKPASPVADFHCRPTVAIGSFDGLRPAIMVTVSGAQR
jgi:hypothetical protein